MLIYICRVFAELLALEVHVIAIQNENMCLSRESNQRPIDLQRSALTTRLSGEYPTCC